MAYFSEIRSQVTNSSFFLPILKVVYQMEILIGRDSITMYLNLVYYIFDELYLLVYYNFEMYYTSTYIGTMYDSMVIDL